MQKMPTPIAKFTVPGSPVSWQRAGSAANGRRFTQPKTRDQEEKIQWLYTLSRKTVKLSAEDYDKGRFAIEVDAFIPNLIQRDVDNFGKLVMDALNKVAYRDDSQVWDLHVTKVLDPSDPRTEVRVYLMTE